jgi:hypothetical protein
LPFEGDVHGRGAADDQGDGVDAGATIAKSVAKAADAEAKAVTEANIQKEIVLTAVDTPKPAAAAKAAKAKEVAQAQDKKLEEAVTPQPGSPVADVMDLLQKMRKALSEAQKQEAEEYAANRKQCKKDAGAKQAAVKKLGDKILSVSPGERYQRAISNMQSSITELRDATSEQKTKVKGLKDQASAKCAAVMAKSEALSRHQEQHKKASKILGVIKQKLFKSRLMKEAARSLAEQKENDDAEATEAGAKAASLKAQAAKAAAAPGATGAAGKKASQQATKKAADSATANAATAEGGTKAKADGTDEETAEAVGKKAADEVKKAVKQQQQAGGKGSASGDGGGGDDGAAAAAVATTQRAGDYICILLARRVRPRRIDSALAPFPQVEFGDDDSDLGDLGAGDDDDDEQE